jgi:hypothetical protein
VVKSSKQNLVYLYNLQKTTQNEQSLHWQKFAQSGQPECSIEMAMPYPSKINS